VEMIDLADKLNKRKA